MRAQPQWPDLVAQAIAPDYALSSHVAPLGLVFTQAARLGENYRDGVFIGEHGSWDRDGVEIPLRRKLPIDSGRDRVEGTGALRVLGARAGRRPSGSGAEEGILDVLVIGGDHIQLVSHGVFCPSPYDLQNLIAKTVHAETPPPVTKAIRRLRTSTRPAQSEQYP